MFKYMFLLFFLIPITNATTLLPLPISEQLKNSKGVIIGNFKSKLYKKIYGVVVTEATFSVTHSIGLDPSEIINKNNYKVIFPGGVWQGQKYQTIGAPEFKIGENVALILKETKLGVTIKGQSLGKYSIKQRGPDVYLTSDAFPSHPLLGKIQFSKFKTQLTEYYTQDIRVFDKIQIAHNNTTSDNSRYIYTDSNSVKTKGRGPASINSEKEKSDSKTSSLFWAGLLFALFGLISTIISRRSQRK